nr:MAG TPA: hypothetical protein [Caudoviricetes sp.]
MVCEDSAPFKSSGQYSGMKRYFVHRSKEVGSIPAPSTYLDVHKSAGAVRPLSVADP